MKILGEDAPHRPVRYDFSWNLCCDPGLDWALHVAPVRLTLSRHYSGLEKGGFRQAATGNVMEMLIIGPLPQLVELKTPGGDLLIWRMVQV